MLQMVFPAAGKGERFRRAGWRDDKPFIRINGLTLLERALAAAACPPEVRVLVALGDKYRNTPLVDRLAAQWRFEPVFVPPTGSVVDTLLACASRLDPELPLVCHDADIQLPLGWPLPPGNGLWWTPDEGPLAQYSYLRADQAGRLLEIREKQRISERACCGVYKFERAGEFLAAARATTAPGERYLSHVIARMLAAGATFHAWPATGWINNGTPQQLALNAAARPARPHTFCFDLDGTLCGPPATPGDYSTCRPLERNIAWLRALHAAGHRIIIHTARRMLTHRGNVQAVVDEIGELTRQQLRDFGVPYHELVFGKPYADFYVDDKAVNAELDPERETGFYASTGLAPRHFNQITQTARGLRKTGDLRGERFFYENCPEDFRPFLPLIHDASDAAIEMQRLPGPTYAQALVSNELAPADLRAALDALAVLHRQPDAGADTASLYLERLEARYAQAPALYAALPQSARVLEDLRAFFEGYAFEPRRMHGDPVFGNILFGPRFIDPRGRVGAQLTLCGDPNYDRAKLLQSLTGYDAVLLGRAPARRTVERLIAELNPQPDVWRITLAHYFCLLPLHTELHQEFWQIALELHRQWFG
jgi:hypothetical protein